jgi:hypothetical protein
MRKPKQATLLKWFSGIVALGAALTNPALAQYSNTVASYGPIGYWTLDDATTSPAQKRVVNAGPLGSVADGFAIGSATMGAPGKLGGCVQLNNLSGAGLCESKIDVPFNYALNKDGAFTVEHWVKLGTGTVADATGYATVWSLMNDFASAARIGYGFYVNSSGRPEFRLGNQAGYVGTINSTNASLNCNTTQFRHVVGVFNGTQTRIYVDGVLCGVTTLSAAQISDLKRNTQTPFRIGGTSFNGTLLDTTYWSAFDGAAGNRGFNGFIDEVAYYPTALSDAQIAAHFAAATSSVTYAAAVLADGAVGYWPLDEAAFSTPGSLPIAVNSGSAGSGANAIVGWGGLANQPGVPFGGMGAGNKAVSLDGFNGSIIVPADPGLDVTPGGQITMMAWIKPTMKNGMRNIIARGWDGNYAETFLRFDRLQIFTLDPFVTGGGYNGGYGTTNRYAVGTTDGGGETYYDTASIAVPEGDVGNWVHLAGTYDGSAWNLYRNGQLVSSTVTPNGPNFGTNTSWRIGSRFGPPSPTFIFAGADVAHVWTNSGFFFGGTIDEPAIFNTALSASQISNIYASALVSPIVTKPIASPSGFVNQTWPTQFKGGSATLTVIAEGAPTLTYQWYSNSVALGTGTSQVLNNLQIGTPNIEVVVSNPYGSATSSVTLTVVAAPPSFPVQPVAVSRFPGYSFGFWVTPAGSTPMSFQWKLNGVDIPGANATNYAGTASVGTAGTYTCVASNEAGVVTSSGALLTVYPAAVGYTATVLSNSPIAYYRLGEASGSIAYDSVGYLNGTYFTTTLGVAGYSVIDSNTAASFSGVNSYAGRIDGNPGTGLDFEGTNANFTIALWCKGASGQPDETSLVAKGTGADGTTANEQFAVDIAGGNYRFFVRSPNGNQFQAQANVGPNPNSWDHVVAVYDSSNPSQHKMRLYVNGELKDEVNGPNTGPKLLSSFVSIGSKRLGNSPDYNGTFNGSIDEVIFYNTALSSTAVFDQYAAAYGSVLPPTISTQPKAVTNYAGLNATFSVGAYGSVPLSYQWQKNNVDIGGANSSVYTISGLTAGDAGNYRCVVSNGLGTTNSAAASLTVLPAPTAPVAIPGLVMRHSFDSTLVDATGRGNNGVAIQRVGIPASSNVVSATYTSGKLGQALSYSSDFGAPDPVPGTYSTTNVNYVTLGLRPDLQFTNSVNFSVAFWVKMPVNFIGGDLPIFGTSLESLGNPGFCFAPAYGYGNSSGTNPDDDPTNPGGWGVAMYGTDNAGARFYGDTGSINDGEWQHLVFVFERNSQVTVYQNGTNASSSKIAGTSTANAKSIDNGQAAVIGQDPTGLYRETGSGEIDDLGVWKKALTPLEAASIYAAGINGFSFTGAPFSLGMTKSGANVILTWDVGMLQSASVITGPWTDVGGAALSPLTVPAVSGPKYYRLKL